MITVTLSDGIVVLDEIQAVGFLQQHFYTQVEALLWQQLENIVDGCEICMYDWYKLNNNTGRVE